MTTMAPRGGRHHHSTPGCHLGPWTQPGVLWEARVRAEKALWEPAIWVADLGVTRLPQGGPGPYHLGPVGQQQALVIHHEQADATVCTVGEGGAQVTGDEVSLVLRGEAQALEGVPAKQPCGRLVLGRHRPEPHPVLGVGIQEPSGRRV